MGLHAVATESWKVSESYLKTAEIALVSDQSDQETLPFPVRSAADKFSGRTLKALIDVHPPDDVDGMMVWCAGEQLIRGDAAGIRRHLMGTPARTYLPVHFPCLTELDLICIQPRLVSRGATVERIGTNVRIAGNTNPSADFREALQASDQPWAGLQLSILDEMRSPGAGIELLAKLWLERRWHPSVASLVLRNLIVLMIRHDREAEARSLLKQGLKIFPHYSELWYISALLAAKDKSISHVMACLRRATEKSDATLVGSGGEKSYRAHWLMAQTMEPSGEQHMILHHYRSGLLARPAFEPSVIGLLGQRLPFDAAYRLRLELCPLARRESKYFEPVFYFLLLHRQLDSALRLLNSVALPEGHYLKYLREYQSVASAYGPAIRRSGRPGLVLTGPFCITSSFARVNREIGISLVQSKEFQAALEPQGVARLPLSQLANSEILARGLYSRPEHCDLTIRHHWPPDFRAVQGGKLVTIVPWEYGAVPVRWVREIRESKAELWVPSEFVRGVFVRAGVASESIKVLPYGIDPASFHAKGPVGRPARVRGFVFLFVGGVIERKGVDLLAKAYVSTFTSKDDVTLVIKEQGSNSFYQNSKLLKSIQQLSRKKGTPRVVILRQEMTDEELASLYRGADAFVLPYRGEGFGMPLLEALACGTPVITTSLGPAREFCPAESSWFLDAKEVPMQFPPTYLGELSGNCTWFEPDLGHLSALMRRAYEERKELRRFSAQSSESVTQQYAWPALLARYHQRIRELTSDAS
jgi:glycosyltransferase involved in cell wall biosynthesis